MTGGAMNRTLCCCFVLSAGAALGPVPSATAADYSFYFTTSNAVSPEHPQTTVTLWATFHPNLYAFAQSDTAVTSVPDSGNFFEPNILMDQYYACYRGNVSQDGDSVTQIFLNQYQGLLGEFADTRNPLPVWSVTWATDDFTPRVVPIWSVSSSFYVYLNAQGTWQSFFGPDFSEAQGVISVVYDGCYPDFTADGALDLFDFLAFVNAFNADDSGADCNRDGALDLFDFLCFNNAFNTGC